MEKEIQTNHSDITFLQPSNRDTFTNCLKNIRKTDALRKPPCSPVKV